eukprot:8617123-Lingulodinium_polyedra.AAC.1
MHSAFGSEVASLVNVEFVVSQAGCQWFILSTIALSLLSPSCPEGYVSLSFAVCVQACRGQFS